MGREPAYRHRTAIILSATVLARNACRPSEMGRVEIPIRRRLGAVAPPRSTFFLERHAQTFGEATKCERGAPQCRVLFGEPGKFLATMRTLISHREGPLRSPRPFDDIHTRDNAANRRTVRPGAPPPPRSSTAFAFVVLSMSEG